MRVTIDKVVRLTIRHAERMAESSAYEWPTTRGALTKILADLEERSPADPSLGRLRDYIAQGDRAFARRKGAS